MPNDQAPLNTDDVAELVEVYEQVDQFDTAGQLIGRLTVHDTGHLDIAQVIAGREVFLRAVVAHMNGKAALSLLSSEPAAQPYATRAIHFQRGEPGFVAALYEYLRTYYGLRLA